MCSKKGQPGRLRGRKTAWVVMPDEPAGSSTHFFMQRAARCRGAPSVRRDSSTKLRRAVAPLPAGAPGMYFPSRGKVPKAARGRRISKHASPAPDPRAAESAVLPEPRRGALARSGYVPRTRMVRWPTGWGTMYVIARADCEAGGRRRWSCPIDLRAYCGIAGRLPTRAARRGRRIPKHDSPAPAPRALVLAVLPKPRRAP